MALSSPVSRRDLVTAQHLPNGLELQRTTPTFDETSTPRGLRAAHAVADGVWGRLIVESGSLGFVFEDAPDDVHTVAAGEHQVIPPARLHHVILDGPVRFAVEFHR
jgi:tellurite resistance-related uncharacterized protein